ncbi:MAG TPA: hypothetical protein VHK88_05485, partial [Aquihabitans sp.]|nr:hypothetical protein [Aquihabitans sp.]
FASVGAVAVLAAVVAIGAPRAPGYLRASDAEAVEGALRPAVAPPSSAGAAPATAPTTTATRVLSATTLPTPAPSLPAPGTTPFDPTLPQLVPDDASADPAGRHGRDLRVMVAGDSVGWTLARYAGPHLEAPVRIDNRALVGCGVMPGDAQIVARKTGATAYPGLCEEAPEADRLGIAGRPDVVLLWVGAWEIYDHRYQDTIYRAGTPKAATLVEERIQLRIDRYRTAGLPTVLSLLPCFTDGEAAFDDKRLFLERLDEERVEWVNDRVRAVAARNLGWVRLIDPREALCTPDGGARLLPDEGRQVRIDGAHFDEGSAPWLWDTWLAGQLAAALPPPG